MLELVLYTVGPWALEVWGFDRVFSVMAVIMAALVILNKVQPAERIRLWRQAQARRQTPIQAQLPIDTSEVHSESLQLAQADEHTWRSYTSQSGSIVHELGEPSRPLGNDEHRDLLLRLRLELAESRAEAEALRGDAVARLHGRLHSWRGQVAVLAVPDGDGHQRIMLAVPDADERESLSVGMRIAVIARYVGGRLVAERFIGAEEDQLPLPELPVPEAKAASIPDWFDSNAKNEKRPFLKASDGSSSVSELRVHLVWATKRRGKVLTVPMIDRLKVLTAEAVKEKGLGRLLAVNAEADHVHVALWLPANLAGSEAAGIIKSYTSRCLRREFPGLKGLHDEALWQRGCFVGSIGAAGHLEAVLSYIAEQSTPQASQADQDGAFPIGEGEESSAT